MITDAQLTFSDGQAITADAASTNQVDLTTARNLARSGAEDMRFIVVVTEAFNNLTSMTAAIRQSAASNMGSPDTILQGPAVTLASGGLAVGKKLLDVPWPDTDPVAAKQYLDVYYDITGTAPSTGKVSAFIVLNSRGGEYRLGNTGR